MPPEARQHRGPITVATLVVGDHNEGVESGLLPAQHLGDDLPPR